MRKDITADRLRELLSYDPATGVFTWLQNRGGGARSGDVAGSKGNRGYVVVGIHNHDYTAHILAWFYTHGVWPSRDVDHKNGIRHDNRLSNLRLATESQNGQNQYKPSKNNTSGYLGVSHVRNKWKAQIKIDGVNHYLGTFPTPEEANTAYLKAKRELHPFWQER